LTRKRYQRQQELPKASWQRSLYFLWYLYIFINFFI